VAEPWSSPCLYLLLHLFGDSSDQVGALSALSLALQLAPAGGGTEGGAVRGVLFWLHWAVNLLRTVEFSHCTVQ